MAFLIEPRLRVVASACAIQAVIIGCMFGYGVFFKVLEEEMGWSRTLLSGASSLAFLVMGTLAYVGGRLNDRHGPRWVLSVTGLLTGIGYLLMSQMQAPWQLLLYFGFFIGLGLSTHDVVTLSTVASWYDKRRGVMTGIVKTGAACGQMLVPLLVTLLIAALGWRQALFYIGLLVAVVLVLLAQLMHRPGNETAKSGSRVEMTGMSMPQARVTSALWTLCAIQFFFFPALMSVPVHIVAHASDLGLTPERAATVLALIGGSSILGRLAIGHLFDVLGGKLCLLLCLLPLALSMFALLLISDPILLFVVAPVYGISHGGLFTVVSPTVAEFFGMRAHGAIFGAILFFGTLGGAAGPLVTGIIFDRMGSYDYAFIVLGVLVLLGAFLASILKKPSVRNQVAAKGV